MNILTFTALQSSFLVCGGDVHSSACDLQAWQLLADADDGNPAIPRHWKYSLCGWKQMSRDSSGMEKSRGNESTHSTEMLLLLHLQRQKWNLSATSFKSCSQVYQLRHTGIARIFRGMHRSKLYSKPYIVYRTISLSMTLTHQWLGFQGRHIFRHWISQKRHEITRAIVTIGRQ